MRVVFVGASEIALRTSRLLMRRGAEVVIIERERGLIEELQEKMDCGFLHGDGSKPAILKEAGPTQTDLLFCLTDDDRSNMIASLVGRSLGFPRIITRIEDPEFEPICQELGLSDTIVPSLTISRYLADIAQGLNILELSTAIKAEARFFAFILKEGDIERVEDLDLPKDARAICLYRDGKLKLLEADSKLHCGDEIVILTHSKNLATLHERWEPNQAKE